MAGHESFPVKGDKLREERINRGLTRPEAAKEAGIAGQTWVNIEAGHWAFLPTLRKLAIWMGGKTRAGDLIDREAHKKAVEARKAASA